MRTKKYVLLSMLAILVLTLANCDDGGTYSLVEPPEDTPDIVYPIEVPFTELLLAYTASCDWRWSDFNDGVTFKHDSIHIINNMDELEKYISCKDDNDPNIDFSKNSILAVRGFTPSVIGSAEKRLLQVSENVYLLNVEILVTGLAQPDVWSMMAITNKLGEKNNVELNVIINEPPIVPPEKETLVGTSWKLTAFVDATTGESREPNCWGGSYVEIERTCDDMAYTMTFINDSIIAGRNVVNMLDGFYSVDYNAGTISFGMTTTEACCDWGDGELYGQLFAGIYVWEPHPFKLYSGELHLFYNDGKEYLKYKKIEYIDYGSIHIVYTLANTSWQLVAFVDVATGESTEPEFKAEFKECEDCYTLEFNSDTTVLFNNIESRIFNGKGVITSFTGYYIINYTHSAFFVLELIYPLGAPRQEMSFGYLISAYAFEREGDNLKLYYDNLDHGKCHRPCYYDCYHNSTIQGDCVEACQKQCSIDKTYYALFKQRSL